jgi:hypothetical protein
LFFYDDDNQQMSKRKAEVPMATLGDVAKETRFQPLWELLESVKDTRVIELSAELRSQLLDGEAKATKLLLLSFFAACDVLAKPASSKRPNVSSDESAPGENQLLLFFFFPPHPLLFCSAP